MTENLSRLRELSPEAVSWLIDGEHGLSSKSMFHWLLLERLPDRFHYPLDPADWWRCERLLLAVPELRPRLKEMAAVSPEWSALVERWEDIKRLFTEEAGPDPKPAWEARETYALMTAILRPIEDARRDHGNRVVLR